jgi:fucose permease
MLLFGAIAQPLGGWAFDRLGGRRVFTIAAASSAVLVVGFAVTGGALSLIAVGGLTFVVFSQFPVVLAQASHLVPPAQTGAATGAAMGLASLMTAAALPAVGALAEAVGDIRVALAWQLPLLLVALALALKTPE